MTSEFKTLHFTFTPVQSFVSQARRTRDLWVGSYLLSWLAGQAMHNLQQHGGEIIMPDIVADQMLEAISKPSSINQDSLAASLGTLPNRFTATIPKNLDGSICTNAIHNSWYQAAAEVKKWLDPGDILIEMELWNKQIEYLWECSWVIGESSGLLDQRKNIRIPQANEEAGEKCTTCGVRQELSESKQYKPTSPNKTRSREWWQHLQKIPRIGKLNLRKNERLCAVCLTKRLFPLIAKKVIGWDVEPYYPSTAYLSAIDWLAKVLELAETSPSVKNAANAFLQCVENEQDSIYFSERHTRIAVLDEKKSASGINSRFIDIDGDMFYRTSIENGELELQHPKNFLKALKQLQTTVGSKASPFYAILLMDGDGMGKLIDNKTPRERQKISKALAAFTKKVPEIVSEHNGRLIYAGGDDVFALLPVSKAIQCAGKCRSAYQHAFSTEAEFVEKPDATISVAIQFAHMNAALGVVVRDTHHLLDDIAKEATGRDALACRVWKTGGPVLTWSQPWTKIMDGILIQQVMEAFQDKSDDSDQFSSRFFYKLRNLFEMIQTAEGPVFSSMEIMELLTAEYLMNREHQWNKDLSKQEIKKIAQDRISKLMDLCRMQTRKLVGDSKKKEDFIPGPYKADGALLVRFLVQKEV